MDGHTSMPALRLFFRNRCVKIGRGRLRLHGRCSLDQRDDVPLCVGIALNVPLRCCERRMAYQFLDVAQTTAGLCNFFAAAVMKDLWPECEDALLIPISR